MTRAAPPAEELDPLLHPHCPLHLTHLCDGVRMCGVVVLLCRSAACGWPSPVAAARLRRSLVLVVAPPSMGGPHPTAFRQPDGELPASPRRTRERRTIQLHHEDTPGRGREVDRCQDGLGWSVVVLPMPHLRSWSGGQPRKCVLTCVIRSPLCRLQLSRPSQTVKASARGATRSDQRAHNTAGPATEERNGTERRR